MSTPVAVKEPVPTAAPPVSAPSSTRQQGFTTNFQVRPHRTGRAALAVVADFSALIVVLFSSFALVNDGLQLGVSQFLKSATPFVTGPYLSVTLIYAFFLIVACYRQKLYQRVPVSSALDEYLAVLKAASAATAFLLAVLYVWQFPVSRQFLALGACSSTATLALLRTRRRSNFATQSAAGVDVRNVVIVGAGKVGRSLADFLKANPQLGFEFKGFLDSNHEGSPDMLGELADFPEVVRCNFIDDVFVTIPSERNLVKTLALESLRLKVNLSVVPDLFDGLGWVAPLTYVGEYPVMRLHVETDRRTQYLVKRVFDLVATSLGLIIIAPVMAFIAALVKFDSRGPVFYRAARVGRKGEPFTCYKFRTMIANADELLPQLQHLNQRDGILFKIDNDPRITKLGRILRKYSLDELPQLFNVIKGDMSLVGPRPPAVNEYRRYEFEHFRRLNVIPGITGLWQVTARRDPSFQSYIGRDLEYIENWSLWMDIKILFRTVAVVFQGTGQ